MTDTSKIREHMDVVCSCGTRLGAVDHVDGNRIKLTKSDPSAGGKHHWVPLDWVENIDGNRVLLNKNSEEARADWSEEGAVDQSRGAMSQQGGRASPAKSQPSGTRSTQGSQQDAKTAPQGDTASGAPAKAGATRGRGANADQDSETQPRM